MLKSQHYLAFFTLICLTVKIDIGQAQTYTPSNRTPVADTSLGTQVSGSNNNFTITGGAAKGQTLFHSFTDFSVPTNGQANFTNPAGNRNIITRVTGSSFSDINGLINSNGANFFLINPNGITFGTGAQLNVGKTFMGSTANGINLVDPSGRMIEFGTNSSGDAPLLSVAPNVLFNVSSLTIGADNAAINNFGTIQTNNQHQYIGLIGGTVNINGGQIIAPGGRVELGGLSAPGNIRLSVEGNNLRAQLPTNVARGDVSIAKQARIEVTGAGDGDIAIGARNIELSSGSTLNGGITPGLGTPVTVAGDIKLNATDAIVVASPNGGIFNSVGLNSEGKGGNITIETGSFSLKEGASLIASTNGKGDAGNINVKASSTLLISRAVDPARVAKIESIAGPKSAGSGGNITLDADSVFSNGAYILTGVSGKGNGGNITVNAKNAVEIKGSYLSSAPGWEGTANSGNIEIAADSVTLANTYITASNTALVGGNSGNVTVNATNAVVVKSSDISSRGESLGGDKAGNINITAASLLITENSQLTTGTIVQNSPQIIQPTAKRVAGNINIKVTGAVDLREGDTPIRGARVRTDSYNTDGGSITIDANSISLQGNSQLSTSTFRQGNAGNVTLVAKDSVRLDGKATIGSNVEAGGVGNGGTVNIKASSLSLTNGAQLLSTNVKVYKFRQLNLPAGQGNAGNINVKVTGAVDIAGVDAITKSPSRIGTEVETGTVGNGGNISIDAGSFLLRDGAQLVASTGGQGNAGTIQVNAADFINISGSNGDNRSGVFVTSDSLIGTAGDIILTSPKITLDGGGLIFAQSKASNGGNINIGGKLLSSSTSSQGGKIDPAQITSADLLLLRRGSQLSTSAEGTAQQGGNGGNINIKSNLIVAIPNENSDITANAVKGKGGNVTINAQGLFGTQFSPFLTNTSEITASSTFGQSGNVNIVTPGIDPGKNNTELPTVPTDASNQISQVCGASNSQNKLTVTGRGGLPTAATDLLSADALWQDDRTNSSTAANNTPTTPVPLPPPAIGLVFDGNGKATLVAAKTDKKSLGTNVTCPNNQQNNRSKSR